MFQREVAAALLLIVCAFLLHPCYGEFCDEGPPGRYCFQNLTGWHECIPGPKGIVDKLHYCAEKTRCQCFYGPVCNSEVKDPCAPFVLPPKLAAVSTGAFTGNLKQCFAGSCKSQILAGMTFIDSDKGKWRQDLIQSTSRWAVIALPTEEKQWVQYTIEWNSEQCTKQQIGPMFPRNEIPDYFQYQGDFKIDGYPMKLWEWQTGAHNRGQPLDITRIYTWSYPAGKGQLIGRSENYHFGTELSKENFNKNISYVLSEYKVGEIIGGDSVFDLPKICQ